MGTPPERRYLIGCPPECQLHPDKIGEAMAEALLGLKEAGAGKVVFGRKASALLGRTLPGSSVSRHLLHYKEIAPEDGEPAPEAGRRVSDLEILDAIITSGFRNSRSWRPSIKDTLDAMRLKVQLTGNSAFEDLISLFDGAEDPEEADEAPEAVAGEDERAQGLVTGE